MDGERYVTLAEFETTWWRRDLKGVCLLNPQWPGHRPIVVDKFAILALRGFVQISLCNVCKAADATYVPGRTLALFEKPRQEVRAARGCNDFLRLP